MKNVSVKKKFIKNIQRVIELGDNKFSDIFKEMIRQYIVFLLAMTLWAYFIDWFGIKVSVILLAGTVITSVSVIRRQLTGKSFIDIKEGD